MSHKSVRMKSDLVGDTLRAGLEARMLVVSRDRLQVCTQEQKKSNWNRT